MKVLKQLDAYRQLAGDFAGKKTAKKLPPALQDFDGLFFNNLTLALDRFYVHRLRMVAGKDGNPLNEVELICDSLMNNQGILRGNNVIDYVPDQSVVKLKIGDRIQLTAAEFERLSAAFFAELERKFLAS